MNILIVYAHPNRKSFCRAVLQKVMDGLKETGHIVDLIDLYAIHFDPDFDQRKTPSTIAGHQKKIAWADGLVYIAPVYWLGFPAIMKGWFKRVFSAGFADALTPEGWQGDSWWRVPLLKHQKALVINTTQFREEGDKPMLERAMAGIVDQWGLRYPGAKKVEHVTFSGVPVVDDATRRGYLAQAYSLGKEFLTCGGAA